MRVLVIPQDYPSINEPTAGKFVACQVRALAERGHDVAVLRIVPWAPPVGSSGWARYRAVKACDIVESVEVRALRALVLPRMIGLSAVAAQVSGRIRAEIARHRAQIVHVHGLLPTARCALNLDVPTVVTAHGTDAYQTPWRRDDLRRDAQRAIQSATATVAVSGFVASRLYALGARDPRVIWNGADADVFAPANREAARDALALSHERKVIVYAGRLHRDKGIFELAAALDRLRENSPLLYVAGDGPDRAEFERRLRAGRIEVRFVGLLAQRDLAVAFAAADVITLPSHREGLPAVVCEAMLAGRAVVATPVGGIPEILRDGETGRLIPVNDIEALAAALGDVLGNAWLRDALGRAAAQFAATHLTWSRNALLNSALYEEIARQRRSA
jgi:teichuronic acid biosynthesis glycosyltransferase TuaC